MAQIKEFSRVGVVRLIAAVRHQAEKDLKYKNAKSKYVKTRSDYVATAEYWLKERLPIYQELLPELCNKSNVVILHNEEF